MCVCCIFVHISKLYILGQDWANFLAGDPQWVVYCARGAGAAAGGGVFW